MASIVGVRRSLVSICHGHRSREQRLRFAGSSRDASEVMKLLELRGGESVQQLLEHMMVYVLRLLRMCKHTCYSAGTKRGVQV